MIGRRVTVHPWHAAMCDALVRFDDGRSCWFGSNALRPADGLGPLPSRHEARAAALEEQCASLRKILRDHIIEFRRRWTGCEFAKALIGNAILDAMKSAGLDPQEEMRRAML